MATRWVLAVLVIAGAVQVAFLHEDSEPKAAVARFIYGAIEGRLGQLMKNRAIDRKECFDSIQAWYDEKLWTGSSPKLDMMKSIRMFLGLNKITYGNRCSYESKRIVEFNAAIAARVGGILEKIVKGFLDEQKAQC